MSQDIMEQATKIEEYRKGKIKAVKLPSKLASGEHPIFIIRKPPTRVLIKFFQIFGLNPATVTEKDMEELVKTKEYQYKIMSFLDELLPVAVVEPRITVDPRESNALHIDELEPEDQIFLANAIFEHAGITAKAMERRRKFRRESSG